MNDILIEPKTEKVIAVISQDRWERKWSEIIAMHCSPHDVWTVQHNWQYVTILPDNRMVPGVYQNEFPGSKVFKLNPGTYSFTNIHGAPVVVSIDKHGRRLIRNHRAYWKFYLVPNFFSESQWDYLCKYHKAKYRQLFCKGLTFPVDKDTAKIEGEDHATIVQCQKDLYKKFRNDKELCNVIGYDHYNKTHRMDCWNWGSGDISDFVPIRTTLNVKKGEKFSLDFLSEETKIKAMDNSIMIRPKYHKVITEKVFV